MNRNQWFVLGIGLFIFGWILESFAMFCPNLTGELLAACYIQRYAFTIPALISSMLGILFVIMGWLEPKTKAEIERKEARSLVKDFLAIKDVVWENEKEEKKELKMWRKYLKRKYPTVYKSEKSKKK